MGFFMNSYHLAILQASNFGKFPELGDVWRNFHPDSVVSDCEYFYEDSCRFEPTTSEEAITGYRLQKILYVPVTRKVSPPTWTKASKSTCKVILTTEKKSQKLRSGIIQK